MNENHEQNPEQGIAFDKQEEYRERVVPLLKEVATISQEMGISFIMAFAIQSDGEYIKTDARISCNGRDFTPPEMFYASDIFQHGLREAHKRMSMRMLAAIFSGNTGAEEESDKSTIEAMSDDPAQFPGKLN